MTYFKRYRMEYDLRYQPVPRPQLPEGYSLVAFRDDLVHDHAMAKFESFEHEIDAAIFPCLGDQQGCLRLMEEIVGRPGFLPEATWLIQYDGPRGHKEVCGTIQGLEDSAHLGAIQNIGVTPFHRNRGLGSALVRAALTGFRVQGLTRAYLEVTAHNVGAVELYQRLGFRRVKTLYKPVEPAVDHCVG